MPHPKGVGSIHKIVSRNNQGRQQTTTRYNRCFNLNYIHSKRNEFSSLVIPVPSQLNNSVVNPPQLSSVRQQSSSSPHNTPRYNRCFNSKESHSKINYFSSPVIHVLPPFHDSVINPHQMSLVCQGSSRSSQNTTPELQASSIPGRTSPDLSNTMPPPSTNNVTRNIYGWMVDVSNLTPA